MTTRRRPLVLLVTALVLAACGGSADDGSSTTQPTRSTPTTGTSTSAAEATGSGTLGPEARPAELVAPDEVRGPAPLLVLLHGYGGSPAAVDGYLGVTEQARSRGLYVLLPAGTSGSSGRFWDATAACCNFTGTSVDDVTYLHDLIEEAIRERPIDPGRVYVLGFSNGGFMAYRLGCKLAGQVTAIAVLAGSDLLDEGGCERDPGVSVLHLHGTADQTIDYEGGSIGAPFPGAVEVVARWAARGGCDGEPVDGAPLDLDTRLPGAETRVARYEGCAEGVDVQLDTIEGGGHGPALDHERVGEEVLDWLLAHAR